jgi:hypothetical protein
MDDPSQRQSWPILEMADEALLDWIMKALSSRTSGSPYSSDGLHAASIALLPPGLAAMAATHWLDLSLTLDGITWHFGNFGEPQLVAATETGLNELGLHELAACFSEAMALMVPLLAKRTAAGGDIHQILRIAGLEKRAAELDRKAWALDNLGPEKSLIYEAWIRYTRQYPERVFDL